MPQQTQVALAWVTGARRSEIAGLHLTDYTPTGENEGDLIIKGKGDKVRTAYIFDGAAAALSDWLMFRGGVPDRRWANFTRELTRIVERRAAGNRGSCRRRVRRTVVPR